MEKLIELLNKFIKEKKHYHWTFENKNEVSKYECLIISKQFKFIKWLVDNDKIDVDKLRKESNNIKLSLSSNFRKNKNGGLENYFECKLLMLLSIQDKPIEFLIYILK